MEVRRQLFLHFAWNNFAALYLHIINFSEIWFRENKLMKEMTMQSETSHMNVVCAIGKCKHQQ